MPRYVLAHDVGTTGNKATLFDEDGALLRGAFVPYPTSYPHTGWAEPVTAQRERLASHAAYVLADILGRNRPPRA